MRETLIYLAHLDHEDTEKQVCLISYVYFSSSFMCAFDDCCPLKFVPHFMLSISFAGCLKIRLEIQKFTNNYCSTAFNERYGLSPPFGSF